MRPFYIMFICTQAYADSNFLRGDANGDGHVDVSDAVYLTLFLYSGGDPPPRFDAADVNDSGQVDISDPQYLYTYFQGGPDPKPPFPKAGLDCTQDVLDVCQSRGGPFSPMYPSETFEDSASGCAQWDAIATLKVAGNFILSAQDDISGSCDDLEATCVFQTVHVDVTGSPHFTKRQVVDGVLDFGYRLTYAESLRLFPHTHVCDPCDFGGEANEIRIGFGSHAVSVLLEEVGGPATSFLSLTADGIIEDRFIVFETIDNPNFGCQAIEDAVQLGTQVACWRPDQEDTDGWILPYGADDCTEWEVAQISLSSISFTYDPDADGNGVAVDIDPNGLAVLALNMRSISTWCQ